jgi:predicted membrane channel-forming protein YqfA (hemolysin III family)
MSEPTTITSTGLGSSVALVSLATITLGPILGENVVILALGLLGTLIALSEEHQDTWKDSLIFILKGVVFSLVFTGLLTVLAIQYLPKNLAITPSSILGIVAFLIGWTSNKWPKLKDLVIGMLVKSPRKEEKPKEKDKEV